MVTALYRRYRPETFAELIGQSQVTDPLTTALRTDRVNHAYLFSGPRGCGKTTSARILARCLNCAEGPTDNPCGVCPSCVELSRDGGGSLDVVEIDAASHNGVDDARDLRERAVFAPARDRYKIFILDEAHMVTPQGFNALLKIVEEPPEHIKFIFATTEPDKVIGTIRSRTHHYPFRLVPPAQMLDYVGQLCESEGVKVEAGVLPLVVRAGGGSVRDTLSLLDQLIAGSEGDTVVYERAVALLGYTHGALLSEVIDALGAKDAGAAFESVDRVIQTGQDPRRFVEDLLEKLRDLIVVSAFPLGSHHGAAAVLRGVQDDELDHMAQQAARFGQAELSRTADIVASALTEMTGATSPRLHLELMVARVLVPASDESERGALARVERLERRVGVTGSEPAAAAVTAEATPAAPAAGSIVPESLPGQHEPEPEAEIAPVAQPEPARSAATESRTAPASHPAPAESAPAESAPAESAPAESAPAAETAPAAEPAPAAESAPEPEPALQPERVASAAPVGPVTLQQVRDAWPQVLDTVQRAKRTAWMVLFTAEVRELRDGEILVLEFPSQKDVESLKAASAPGEGVGDHLKRAVSAVLGFTPKLIARVAGPGGTPAAPTAPSPDSRPSTSPDSRPSSSPIERLASSTAEESAPRADSAQHSGRPEPRGGTSAGVASPEQTAAAAPVTEDGWATVAIPGAGSAGNPPATGAPSAEPRQELTREPTPSPKSPSPKTPSAAPPVDDEPPFDDEPPYDPEYDTVPPAPSRVPAPAPSRPAGHGPAAGGPSGGGPATGGPLASQKYGEAVVRQVLGATFIEEQPHTPRVTPGAN
ncbi:DNA polymerase III subunit gamma and tau [Salinibacterium sp. SYSU T00001]|uniref:DNA polymerase III subunit gamma and tau n=1 Tax=Homoserinimonas sedimenticola TaxID=2986805 RepID=UPI0022364C40|nr:DNA polymerase III subunit gamma and tau [Salinibacterium sedimenticola]MCW4385182.1 DNA polymerase III subunit gamma and tau [Salinibacterium sedimenticola]